MENFCLKFQNYSIILALLINNGQGYIVLESKISKKVRQQLRELISAAYTQEISHHLHELALNFDQWRNNKITCWELSDFIHQFHDGISRELFNLYNHSRYDIVLLLSRAVAQNLISLDAIPSEVREMVSACEPLVCLPISPTTERHNT